MGASQEGVQVQVPLPRQEALEQRGEKLRKYAKVSLRNRADTFVGIVPELRLFPNSEVPALKAYSQFSVTSSKLKPKIPCKDLISAYFQVIFDLNSNNLSNMTW